MNAPTRPILRYLGSKWRLAPKILPLLPPHDFYVEPYGGSAALLAQKAPCDTEIWNDLDGELVNLFATLRGPQAGDLIRQLELTPYARAEFRAARMPATSGDAVERARRLLVRSHLGHGNSGTSLEKNPGFRLDGLQCRTRVAGEWREFPDQVWRWVDRLRNVQIEQLPALRLLQHYDDPRVLMYLDPPYVPATRSTKVRRGEGYHTYAHELDAGAHAQLLDCAVRSKAMVLISGYPSDLYDSRLQGWRRVELRARAYRNLQRTEVLWINPAAQVAHGLFGSAA